MLTIVAVGVFAVLVYMAVRAVTKPAIELPPYFRAPIPKGRFRVVGHDDLPGGGELSNVVGDFASVAEAVKEAAAARQLSELKVGQKGQPTRFIVYDDAQQFVCDWRGPKPA